MLSDLDYSWDDQDPDEIQESLEFSDPDEVDEENEDESEESSRPFYDDEWSEESWSLAEDDKRQREREGNSDDLFAAYFDSYDNEWDSTSEERIDYPNAPVSVDEQPDALAKPRFWTIEQDELLIRLYATEISWAEIEAILERSNEALVERVARIGFPIREIQQAESHKTLKTTKWNDFEDAEITEGYETGKNLLSLANQLGRSINAVYLRLAKLRIVKFSGLDHMVYSQPDQHVDAPKRNAPWTKFDEDQLKAAFHSKMQLQEILELTGRTPMGVIQNLYKNKVISDRDLEKMLAAVQLASEESEVTATEA